MNLSKIKSLHVIIIGAVVAVIVGVGLFFVLIKPLKAKIKETEAKWKASAEIAAQEPAARRELDQALKEKAETEVKYSRYQASKMPDIDLSNRENALLQLWKEQCLVLGPLIEKWPRRTGVQLLTGVSVPAPPVNPNVLQTEPPTELQIGTLQVRGPFRKILDHLRSWNRFNRLVRIDMPTLVGPGPGMTSQYALTVIIFPRGVAGQQIALAGAAAGGVAGAPAVAPGGAPAMPMPPTPMPPPGGGAPSSSYPASPMSPGPVRGGPVP